jgi:hypothetical protein
MATLGGAVLAGCTTNQHSNTGASTTVPLPTGSPTPPATPAPFGVAPMTGLPASKEGVTARSAVVVDMYLGGGAPAPSGLDSADMVFEEVTGRNARRLMAVFHSKDAAKIGPVADTWPSDVRNLPVLHPLVASRGATQKFSNVLSSTGGIIDVSYDVKSSAYTSQPGARSPYNLYTSTAALFPLAPAGNLPPPSMLPFQGTGLALATTGIVPAKQVSITVPGDTATVWTVDATTGGWLRQGSSIVYTNLVVLVMPYRAVKTSNHGSYIHTAEVFGSGDAWVAAGGLSVKCAWNRKGAFAASLVVDTDGYPARVLPGTTWMMYAPTGTSVVIA